MTAPASGTSFTAHVKVLRLPSAAKPLRAASGQIAFGFWKNSWMVGSRMHNLLARGNPHGCAAEPGHNAFVPSFVRQARHDLFGYFVLAECSLIFPEAQAPQPDHDVHDGAHNRGWRASSSGVRGVARAAASGSVIMSERADHYDKLADRPVNRSNGGKPAN
jgi:hypothetical protein